MGIFDQIGNFLTGSPEKHKRVSTLRKDQEPLYQQLQNAAMNPGAGGAYGTAADYFRDLMSNDSQTAQQMFAPEQRRFNEEIIPGLAEQFAGMGAGGLSSSGFRNAAVSAGESLSEKLGAIRAQLRAQGAQGLANIGNQALGNYSQDVVTQPGSEGLLSNISSGIGNAIGQFGGNWLSGGNDKAIANAKPVGAKTAPYGAKGYDQQFRQTGVF